MFYLFSIFPLILAFDIGGLGFEFSVFVAGWRHALRSEWPFIIIIIKEAIMSKDYSRRPWITQEGHRGYGHMHTCFW